VVLAAHPLLHAIGWHGLLWLGAGGLAYTLGIIFFAFDRLRYFHATWQPVRAGGQRGPLLCHPLPRGSAGLEWVAGSARLTFPSKQVNYLSLAIPACRRGA